ncbi:unnamed protein product, partial [Gulo gulo]
TSLAVGVTKGRPCKASLFLALLRPGQVGATGLLGNHNHERWRSHVHRVWKRRPLGLGARVGAKRGLPTVPSLRPAAARPPSHTGR